MARVARHSAGHTTEWTVATAKARFSELLECAQSQGPQTIARHGKIAAVVVAASEWQQKQAQLGTLVDFLAQSPLRESGLKVRRRVKDMPRTHRL